MTEEQDIRARALEVAASVFVSGKITDMRPDGGAQFLLALADLFAVYIRNGMDSVAGMLKEKEHDR